MDFHVDTRSAREKVDEVRYRFLQADYLSPERSRTPKYDAWTPITVILGKNQYYA
jgi:hypothetical protein